MELQQTLPLIRTLYNAIINPYEGQPFLLELMPIAISYIMHQRVQFDEDNFNTYDFHGAAYHVFKWEVASVSIYVMKQWLFGAQDAMLKGYLKDMYLIIESAEDSNIVLESYKIRIDYQITNMTDMDNMIYTRQRALKDAAIDLFAAIERLKYYPQYLENDVNFNLLLTYYMDVVPGGYQPPYFCQLVGYSPMLAALY